ncbi:MAG: DUF4194 domain-containing protein [Verrucomicrobiae bacterium]|nr:DUF4194 domain-containing protein [Verrucomicrobiae bacterium]
MNLPWPSFWQHIPEPDRPALSEALTELLSKGVLLGDDGRAREIFLTAREHLRDLAEYLAPLHLDLWSDPDRSFLQARPVSGECGLTAKFNKAETLLVLVLWRLYHETRMERAVETVVVSANDVYQALRLTFEHLEPPTETHLDRMLARLHSRRLIRFQRHDDPQRFGESSVEILPTLPRVIPFESLDAWELMAGLHGAARGTPEPDADTEVSA